MAYTPTVWKNGEFPPIDAEHLNKIEQGIANSAPGGFGLGEQEIPSALGDDANNITATGWFIAYKNTPTGAWWIIHAVCSGDVLYQFAYANEAASSVLMGTVVQRTKKSANNDWSPWEYINPPMKLNTEYRTTERYLGKPVYVKTVDCGLPQTNTTWATPHGISGAKNFISATAQSGVYIANGIFKGSEGLGGDSMTIATDPTNIHISTYGIWSTTEHAIALLKYTKTTD